MAKDDCFKIEEDCAFAVIGDIVWKNCSPAKKLLDEIIEKSTKFGIDVPKSVHDTKEKVVEYKQFMHEEDHKEYFFYATSPQPLYVVEVEKDKVKWCVTADLPK